MTIGHLKVGKQGTELNRIKYQLQIMVQYFIRLSQNLAYDISVYIRPSPKEREKEEKDR